MKLKKTILALGITLAVLGASSSTWANPDYICLKDVVDEPCVVTEWGKWGETGPGIQVGKGTRTTQFAYYHHRTECEAGYSGGKAESMYSGKSGTAKNRYASGRWVEDFVNQSETCYITRHDTEAPTGNPNMKADQNKKTPIPKDLNASGKSQ